jgi:hypothetical protein
MEIAPDQPPALVSGKISLAGMASARPCGARSKTGEKSVYTSGGAVVVSMTVSATGWVSAPGGISTSNGTPSVAGVPSRVSVPPWPSTTTVSVLPVPGGH